MNETSCYNEAGDGTAARSLHPQTMSLHPHDTRTYPRSRIDPPVLAAPATKPGPSRVTARLYDGTTKLADGAWDFIVASN